MTFRVKGIPYQIKQLIVGKVTRSQADHGEEFVYLDDGEQEIRGNFAVVLTTKPTADHTGKLGVVFGIPSLSHLEEGDIVSIGLDGNIRTHYRANSFYNTIVATERCNSNCLMCSQPPKDKDDVPYLFELYTKVIPLIPKDCVELTISGGEPTLMGNRFFELLEQITAELPNTELHILTNGRAFAWESVAARLADIDNPRMMLGIPLYADYYQVHDYIVQAKDAFNQTVIGLHNLAKYNVRIEIRVVLHQQSIPRLIRLARYVFKNLPFAEHVTFMGLEYTGYTPHNIDKLWIDPYEYQSELQESVEFLAGQGMRVSIYNTPLCVIPKDLWQFARKSISDWKNEYLPVCEKCDELKACGGLFTWNLKMHSKYTAPIINQNEIV
ncbi:MAG TPA: His-Xaa-Ser system radical SAM maturase HxsC [Mucilaginibacter sp.]|jgi:His-Xaa-Ser system radical SAM maturase HxsC